MAANSQSLDHLVGSMVRIFAAFEQTMIQDIYWAQRAIRARDIQNDFEKFQYEDIDYFIEYKNSFVDLIAYLSEFLFYFYVDEPARSQLNDAVDRLTEIYRLRNELCHAISTEHPDGTIQLMSEKFRKEARKSDRLAKFFGDKPMFPELKSNVDAQKVYKKIFEKNYRKRKEIASEINGVKFYQLRELLGAVSEAETHMELIHAYAKKIPRSGPSVDVIVPPNSK